LLPLTGLFGVSVTIREASRQAAPVRAQRIAVTLMADTADPDGGPQYLPARVIGPVPRHLDASEILLNMVTAGSLFPCGTEARQK
jgi:hypothetical protein